MFGSTTIALRNHGAVSADSKRFSIVPQAPQILVRNELANETVDVFRAGWTESEFLHFKHRVLPHFRLLDWDPYDVRLIQIDQIKKQFQPAGERAALLDRYYRGEVSKREVIAAMPFLNELDFECAVQPSRKKAVIELSVTDTTGGGAWSVECLPLRGIAQRVERNDYRSLDRTYAGINAALLAMPAFQRLVGTVVWMVRERVPSVISLKITAWMMSCYAFPNAPCTNSPEGIHQDGADYIVSAFVMERRNVLGGKSRIFGLDHSEPLMTRCLAEGEGLFQPDAGTSLFHDVTKIEIANHSEAEGVRSIFGFDVYLDTSNL